MRSALLVFALSAAMAFPALAALPAPVNLAVTSDGTNAFFDWDEVAGATRYVVEVHATLLYESNGEVGEADVALSYSTKDRAWGGAPEDSLLVIPNDALFADVLSAAGLTGVPVGAMELRGTFRIKAMNPGKKSGGQNNPFSAPAPFDSLYWGLIPT